MPSVQQHYVVKISLLVNMNLHPHHHQTAVNALPFHGPHSEWLLYTTMPCIGQRTALVPLHSCTDLLKCTRSSARSNFGPYRGPNTGTVRHHTLKLQAAMFDITS
jgi:hypothetical protein